MNEVSEQEYNDYVDLLVLPTITQLDECGIFRTRHYVLEVLKAEKIEHTVINQVVYKIKSQ